MISTPGESGVTSGRRTSYQHAGLDGGTDSYELVRVDAFIASSPVRLRISSCTIGMRVAPPAKITFRWQTSRQPPGQPRPAHAAAPSSLR
jgi:hypothetical protein